MKRKFVTVLWGTHTSNWFREKVFQSPIIFLSIFHFFFQFLVVSQDYATRVNDFDVILGNSAMMKCEIPSFVADFVSLINWSDNNGVEFYASQNSMGKIIKYSKFLYVLLHVKICVTSLTLKNCNNNTNPLIMPAAF